MGGLATTLQPRDVPKVHTRHRRIVTPIPAPDSIPILQTLRQYEPRSMGGQPPIVWDRAQGFQVFDRWGNTWLDFSSGVLVTNAGNCHPKVKQAILDQVNHGLLHNYCFPSQVRADLVRELARVAPPGLDKVFLLTTGAETTECAIKLARTCGQKVGGRDKITIVTFQGAFHGRTMGAQMAGGIPALKQWIVNLDQNIVQVRFPDGFRNPHTTFDSFLRGLRALDITPEHVAGVMSETYLGGDSSFAPPQYMQQLAEWCDEHYVTLIMDEVQAGFGRTGTFWGFEHYGITPDLICCGKGISSGLPLSAVIGRADIMDLYPPGSMTSTHTGNPVCAASALANLHAIEEDGLVDNARQMGQRLAPRLEAIGRRFHPIVARVHARGLVASLHIVKPDATVDATGSADATAEPDHDRAADIVTRCIEKGLMLFAPVGFGGASVKICPPLCITPQALDEGADVLEEAIEESIRQFTGTDEAGDARL